MFENLKSFFYRHRRKFLFTGILVGGTILLTRYTRRAISEWREKETRLYLERARKRQHYEKNELTCISTALSLIIPMKATILKLINTEVVIAELKNGASSKVSLWEELKLMAFTKVILLVYISSMLMVTLRLQLNLLAGYMFREDTKKMISQKLRGKYIRINQNLMEGGASMLYRLISEKVKVLVSQRSLKEKLTVKDVEQLLWSVHSAVSNDRRNPCKQLATYILHEDGGEVLPPQEQEIYNQILAETRDLFECDDAVSLSSSAITRGLSFVMDSVCEYFVQYSPSGSAGNLREPSPGTSSSPDSFFAANMTCEKMPDLSNVSVPMAKIIPIVNGLVSPNSNTDLPYTWMQQLVRMDDLKVMGANIYETFSSK